MSSCHVAEGVEKRQMDLAIVAKWLLGSSGVLQFFSSGLALATARPVSRLGPEMWRCNLATGGGRPSWCWNLKKEHVSSDRLGGSSYWQWLYSSCAWLW